MIRISGATLPQDKRAEIGLTYIYGVGRSTSRKILDVAGIDINKRIKDFSEDEGRKIKEVIEKNYKIEGDLRRMVVMNIKRLKEISSYRGSRHIKRLPTRGQRTKTNSRTIRGNVRRTIGSGRRSVAQKT
ncbi:30S ribosomal protein S13 [Patescibacteria group bacterium]